VTYVKHSVALALGFAIAAVTWHIVSAIGFPLSLLPAAFGGIVFGAWFALAAWFLGYRQKVAA
jgi:hypothetical protein